MSLPDLSVPSLFNVKGKIALVTGGGTGIGKAIAAALALNGAKVYIAARKEKLLKETAEELNAKGQGRVEYIIANVNNKAGCDALVSEIKKRESKLHILVNNSGITWGAPYDDFPEEKGWDNVFAVNVKSIFYVTAGLTSLLVKDSTNLDPARVINISSTGSLSPHAEGALSGEGNGTWSYNTSKAAVNHLTKALAVKLGPQHVTVNAILPGVFSNTYDSIWSQDVRRQAGTETTNRSCWYTARPSRSCVVPHFTCVIARYRRAHLARWRGSACHGWIREAINTMLGCQLCKRLYDSKSSDVKFASKQQSDFKSLNGSSNR